MKTKHHRIMIILQAIFSSNRNTLPKSENSHIFNMNVIHINVIPLCIASLLTFNNILSCIRKMLDKCHAQSTDFIRQKTNSENVQINFFLLFYKFYSNPYEDCSESTYQNCTDVRNNVQFLYSFDKRKFHKIRRKSQRIYCQMTHRIHE